MRVRKKPVEVDAMQLLDSNSRLVAEWCKGSLLLYDMKNLNANPSWTNDQCIIRIGE